MLYGPPPPKSWEEWSPEFDREPELPKDVSRDEFRLLDNVRILCFFTLMIGIIYSCIGFKALRAIRAQKPWLARMTFKRTIFRIIALAGCVAIGCYFGHDSKKILDKHHEAMEAKKTEPS